MSAEKHPTYVKDSTGYCYTYTRLLAAEPGMEPYDGAVDANGFAIDGEAEVVKVATTKKKSKPAAEPTPAPEPAPEPETPADPLDDALAAATKLD